MGGALHQQGCCCCRGPVQDSFWTTHCAIPFVFVKNSSGCGMTTLDKVTPCKFTLCVQHLSQSLGFPVPYISSPRSTGALGVLCSQCFLQCVNWRALAFLVLFGVQVSSGRISTRKTYLTCACLSAKDTSYLCPQAVRPVHGWVPAAPGVLILDSLFPSGGTKDFQLKKRRTFSWVGTTTMSLTLCSVLHQVLGPRFLQTLLRFDFLGCIRLRR